MDCITVGGSKTNQKCMCGWMGRGMVLHLAFQHGINHKLLDIQDYKSEENKLQLFNP